MQRHCFAGLRSDRSQPTVNTLQPCTARLRIWARSLRRAGRRAPRRLRSTQQHGRSRAGRVAVPARRASHVVSRSVATRFGFPLEWRMKTHHWMDCSHLMDFLCSMRVQSRSHGQRSRAAGQARRGPPVIRDAPGTARNCQFISANRGLVRRQWRSRHLLSVGGLLRPGCDGGQWARSMVRPVHDRGWAAPQRSTRCDYRYTDVGEASGFLNDCSRVHAAAIAVRFGRPVLPRMRCTWSFMVAVLSQSRAAISRFGKPAAMQAAT